MSLEPADLEEVLGWLQQLPSTAEPALAELFQPGVPIVLARAPGRLDVMGGFADYSGSLTLELPLREAAYVALQPRAEPVVRVVSRSPGEGARAVSLPLEELREHSHSYAAAQAYFRRQPADGWVAYVAGMLVALQLELDRPLSSGLSVLVASSVPEGKGVSSSAALEVGTLSALVGLHGLSLGAERAAALCQRVENLVVGAPCGIMDQMTSSCGVEGQLLPLLCQALLDQPAQLQPCFPLPASLALWGIDSGLRHQVSGADYTEVRVAAFMGYRWLAALRGCPVRSEGAGKVAVVDPEWGGYLARVPRADQQRYLEQLPERMTGAEFASRFGGISDPITSVRPEGTYRVRAATAHPMQEHARAKEFRELLLAPELRPAASTAQAAQQSRPLLERLGALMFAAHDSYSACGLGSTGTDRLVQLVRELGPERGLLGAKITGGGSGGTVAVLGLASAGDAVAEVAARYGRELGRTPQVFSGSSPGAAAFGVRRLQHTSSGWRSERGTSFSREQS